MYRSSIISPDGMAIPSCIIRFICHIPTGMVGFNGQGLYNSAKRLDGTGIYDEITNGHEFLQGLQLFSDVGRAVFGWNFPMFLGVLACAGPVLMGVGCIDLILASLLLFGLVQQSKFAQSQYGICGQLDDWPSDQRNFFKEADESKFFAEESPEQICNAMSTNWKVGLAVIVLYMFGGVLNVLLGFLPMVDCMRSRRNYRSTNTYTYGYSSTTSYPRHNLRRHFWHHPIREWGQKRENKGWFSNTIRVCILIPLVAVIKMLDYVGSHTSYASRYCSKLLASRKERFGARLGKEDKTKAKTKGRVLPFNIVSRIAQDLHHADLVSVSRASTPLRTLFFGRTDDDVEERLSMLHEASCEGERKLQCGLCDTQICNTCSQSKYGREESQVILHQKNCHPYCSDCYINAFCRQVKVAHHRVRKRGSHTRYCRLGPKEEKRWEKSDLEMADRHVMSTNVKPCKLCRHCSALSAEERMRAAEERDKAELQRLAMLPLTCESCQVLLPERGPRWWVCSKCECECPSNLHPAWAVAT